ncbi:hypothetical protein PCANC_25388 [Puccinia coronata f. sp. avenae]|uniref:Uncharacterized protein n=1 Tax=Puccinia coronata f. sp. avenae TaxID=200324 RepID=A0A2N5TQZ2_9BASI|nr:hypothetical protein PCANC_25388 [Puccinia coronata f. sp. avenae]
MPSTSSFQLTPFQEQAFVIDLFSSFQAWSNDPGARSTLKLQSARWWGGLCRLLLLSDDINAEDSNVLLISSSSISTLHNTKIIAPVEDTNLIASSWWSPNNLYLPAELLPARREIKPVCWAATSPASRHSFLRGWYQLGKQVHLPVGGYSSASRYTCLLCWHQLGKRYTFQRTCLPSWYQLSGRVNLVAKLVTAQRAGQPGRQAGTSSAGRSTWSPSWSQLSGQVNLVAKLVPAQRAGQPGCRAGTGAPSRSNWSPIWFQLGAEVNLLAELVPAQQAGLHARRILPTCTLMPPKKFTP